MSGGRRADAAGGRWGTAAILLAWCLLAIGDSAHAGYYSTVALVCVSAGFVVLLAAVALRAPLVSPDRALLIAPALVCLVESVVDPTKRFLYVGGADLHAIEALGIATAGVATLALLIGDRWRGVAWLGVLALAAATGIVTIVLINNPGIDVWDILQQSSSGLLHGDDMYRQHWAHSTGLQNVYPYLPGSTLLVAPFRWLLGDVRYGLLGASLLTAWLLRRYGSAGSPGPAALLLVVPGFALLVNRSWTEPLLIAALAATILALRSGRTVLAVLALAVALACKQHIVLFLPLFALWPSFGLRRTASSVGLAALVVLPWLIAGPHDFWHDAVHANLALGVQPKALNLPGLLVRHGDTVGFWFAGLILIGAYLVVLWRVPRTPSGLALGAALVMWAFDLANKQTYFNHYLLPLGLLVIALATIDTAPAERAVDAGTSVSPPSLATV
jgi:hypothetical protein